MRIKVERSDRLPLRAASYRASTPRRLLLRPVSRARDSTQRGKVGCIAGRVTTADALQQPSSGHCIGDPLAATRDCVRDTDLVCSPLAVERARPSHTTWRMYRANHLIKPSGIDHFVFALFDRFGEQAPGLAVAIELPGIGNSVVVDDRNAHWSRPHGARTQRAEQSNQEQGEDAWHRLSLAEDGFALVLR